MKTSEQTNEIATALARAQGELKPAVKDATNPAYRSKYADLAANWEAWREVGPRNGLALVQEPVKTEQGVRVTTRLMHTSGQWIEFEPLEIPLAKHDAHGVGSGVSYGKRYSMGGACGIVAEEDDDGNAAVDGVQRFPKRDFSKGPTHGPAAVNAGLPPPPPTPEQEAATAKEARVLFPTADERAERDKYIAELKRLKFVLGMSDAEAMKVSITYVGKGVPLVTADLPDLAAMVDFMRQKAGLAKFSLSGGEAAVKGGTQ